MVGSEPARQSAVQSVRSGWGDVAKWGRGSGSPGAIVLMGGTPANGSEPEPLHRAALALVRPRRRVAFVGAAWNEPSHIADLVRLYATLGADAVDAGLYDRADATRPETLSHLSRADLIFFVGGAPRQLIMALRDTPAWAAIERAWQGGAALVGSCAGCDCLGSVVVSSTAGPAGRRGFGILPNTVIAGHFSEWQRGSDLAATLTVHPGCIGVGIDEHTAAVIRPGTTAMQVTGRGSVSLWVNGERHRLATAGDSLSLPRGAWSRLWQMNV